MTDEKRTPTVGPIGPPAPLPIPTRKTPLAEEMPTPADFLNAPPVDVITLAFDPTVTKHARETTCTLAHRPTSTQPQPPNAFKKSLDSSRERRARRQDAQGGDDERSALGRGCGTGRRVLHHRPGLPQPDGRGRSGGRRGCGQTLRFGRAENTSLPETKRPDPSSHSRRQ